MADNSAADAILKIGQGVPEIKGPLEVAKEAESLRGQQLTNKKNQFGMDLDQISFTNKNLAALLGDPNITTDKALQQIDYLHASGATPNEQAYQAARSKIAQAKDPDTLRATLGMMLQQIQSPETLLGRNTNSNVQYRNGGTTQFGTMPGANMPNAGIPSFAPSGSIADTPGAHNYDTGQDMRGVPGGVVGNQGPSGLPSPQKLAEPYPYVGPDNKPYTIPYGEAVYRQSKGIPLPGYPGGPPVGTYAQQAGQVGQQAPGAPPVAGYTPRLGQPNAAPNPAATGLPGAVGNVGALTPDGLVAPQGAPTPSGPQLAVPPNQGTATQPAPTAGTGATQTGPSPVDIAEGAGQAGQVKEGWKTYDDLLAQAPADNSLMSALRQAYDVSTLVPTGVGAPALNSRAAQLRTYAQALGVPLTKEMKDQDVASAILNKSSANIVNFNPAAGRAVAALESVAHGSPSAELPQGALREITLQMMGVVQMRNYLREIGQANPGQTLLAQRDAYKKLDPTAFVWDIMSPKEQKEYAGMIAHEKDSKAAFERFGYTYDESRKVNLPPPGGMTGNRQLPPGAPVPTTQPTPFATRNRVLGAPPINPLLGH